MARLREMSLRGGGGHAQADNDSQKHTGFTCCKRNRQTHKHNVVKLKKGKGGGITAIHVAADRAFMSSSDKLGHNRL